jgi:hypothetical protein
MSLRTLSSIVAGLFVMAGASTASAQSWNPLTWLAPPAPRCYGPNCPQPAYGYGPAVNRGYSANYAPTYGPIGYGSVGSATGSNCSNGRCGVNGNCPNGVCHVPGNCSNGQCGVNRGTNYGPQNNFPAYSQPRYDVQPGYSAPRNVAPVPYVPQTWNAAPLSNRDEPFYGSPQLSRTPRSIAPARFEDDEWTVSRAPRTRPVYDNGNSPFYP